MMTKLANGTMTNGPVQIPLVVKTKDRYAKQAGLFWEARFAHPTLGTIVLPYATKAEAEASRLKK
jgi:hypothetical protein